MKKLFFLSFLISALVLILSCNKTVNEKSTSGVMDGSFSGSAGPGGGSSGGGNGGGTPGAMTAGEWNDLENWDYWKTLLQRDTINQFPDLWNFHTQNRISIVLKDANNKLIHNARIIVTGSGETYYAVTDNFGKAEVFPGLFNTSFSSSSYKVKAEYKGQSFDLGSYSSNQREITKTISTTKAADNILDIMFVVDATGSMGDEITYLKTELKDVVLRAGSQLPGVQLRMGSVFYRDHGDEYLTRSIGFTADINKLSSFINDQNAGGGGDFPEAVDEALDVAINKQQWSTNAINRLVFIVLDAPPHNTVAAMHKIKDAVIQAQQKGIRIIPVSASGINKETEFLLRFLAVSTGSTYTFITDHSGIGNPHHVPTVGSYTVEFLNNLMVRLISKYGQNKD